MTLLVATLAMPVRDVHRGVAFHRDRLGFDPVHVGDGVAVLRRDEVEINPWEANNPHVPGAEPHLAGSASSRVRVNGVRALYDECRGQGVVHPNGAPAIQPWGRNNFTVLDANGNAIAFFEPAAPTDDIPRRQHAAAGPVNRHRIRHRDGSGKPLNEDPARRADAGTHDRLPVSHRHRTPSGSPG